MYSNRVVYDETLVPKKSTNGRYVRFSATSGDKPTVGATPVPFVQNIMWNNIQPTSRKNIIKDIRFNGVLKVFITSTNASTASVELIADINRFIDINCTVNGTCNYITHGACIEPVFKAYIDQELIDMSLQSYYQSDTAMPSASAKSHTFTFPFSVKLMHPFLFTELGGCYALNINITTNQGLLGLYKTTLSDATGEASCAYIEDASITYVEYEGASETFIKKVGYMVQYQTKTGSPGTTIESNTRNVSGAPLNVYTFVGVDGATLSAHNNNQCLQKPLPLSEVIASVNNNVNAYNVSGIHEMFGRSKELGYIGQLSDFTSSYIGNAKTKNEMGCVVKISNRMLPMNINTSEIYRFSAQTKYLNPDSKDTNHLYLFTVYEYPALLYLSPEKSTCEYIVNQPIETVDEYFEEDLYSGSGFFDFIKKGFNWLKDKKIISNGARMLANVLPGKAGGIASVVGNVADSLGMSTSVF